jgi:putative glutamine amidotransferase
MRRILIRILGIALLVTGLAGAALFAAFHVPDPASAPRVLVSVDETLWNTFGLNRLTYVRKLRLAGVQPVLVSFAEDGEVDAGLFDDIDGLVLTGGGDVAASLYGGDPAVTRAVRPDRDAFELALLEVATSKSLPVLGLCRGAQLINVQRGGTLGDFRDQPAYDVHHRAFAGHSVTIESGSRLADIYGTDRLDAVTTWHGQHVDQPGRGIEITASGPDGIPEAIEVGGEPFMLGVQWHAEMPPWDRQQEALFVAFADAVRRVR